MFCDVRGFTTIAESLDARKAFGVLGGLLQHVSPIVRMNRGFVDKFIGDAVMGLFPQSPADAAKAAVAIQQAVRRYSISTTGTGGMAVAGEPAAARLSLSVGIGIHTGPTMLGTIGDAERMEATVLSDAVNLSARLESLTRWFGVGILISDTALALIADPSPYEPRAIGHVRVKGKRQSIGVHELLSGDDAATRTHKAAQRTAFAEALALFQRGELDAAQQRFARLVELAREVGVDDGPSRVYVAEAARLLAGPPLPAGWDGCLEVFVK